MWDQRYSDTEYAYGTEPNDFLVEAAHHLPKGNILCIGEGEGRNAVWLAQQGWQVTAMDSSSVGLEKAKQLAESRGVEIQTVHADLADYHFQEAAWDGMVSIFCHLPPALRKQVHSAIISSLRPGGVLLLEAYTPEQVQLGTGGPPTEAMMMNLETLYTELDGLNFNHALELERLVHEGQFHTGLGSVVQLVAVRPD
jgi:2-polyprenyl-3-methyl-5-hydroxy-6-metoxy-1,4-benzoquinol methylase